VAPPLSGVAQRHARPDGGLSDVDATSIRQSILEPEAEITLGYATSMPSYRGQITAAEVDRLVTYIATLAGTNPGDLAAIASLAHHAADAGDAATVIDPVCKMAVIARPESTPFEQGGTTYYFCSEFCRDQFTKAPQSYLKSE
jgi:YHS domain-containing protein